MPYQSETIKTIVDRLNTQYFLPSIQRNFRWSDNQIILLFDSVMRSYPISSFLFWELTSPESCKKWEIFKFCEEAYTGGTQHIKHNTKNGIPNLTLVLDGQQRLSSLMIGLKGVYHIHKPRQRWDLPATWPVGKLYLDLFADPTPIDDEDEFTGKPYYSFKFIEGEPHFDEDHWWFRVGRILDCYDDDEYYRLREAEERKFPEGINKAKENLFERNLGRLYAAIWSDPAISYYVERRQDYDRVLDIFVRANEGGTQLSKAEILMAMLESKWTTQPAKKEIYELINHVNQKLPGHNNRIDLELVLRTCLVLCNLPVRYRVNTFTNQTLALIETAWPNIKKAIIRALTLVNMFGIDSSNLTSNTALIPIIHYLYRNSKISFLGTTPFEVRNAVYIRKWFILTMLNRVYGRGQEQVVSNLRKVINDCPAGTDFPVGELNKELKRMGFPTGFGEDSIVEYLNSEYPLDFLEISLLYDDRFWAGNSVNQDHIFPKALFTASNPEFASLTREKKTLFKELCNRSANLELLLESENNEKRAKPFRKWLDTRDPSFRQKHFIPDDDKLLKFENFDKFISRREELITERLQRIL